LGCVPSDRGGLSEEEDVDYQAGLSHGRAGRPVRAVEAFERALQRNPRSASAHFELGLIYYQQLTNYVSALYHFDRVQRLRPDFRYADRVQQMIRGCKQEFVREVPLGTITLQMQQDLQRLERMTIENAELRRQLDQLRVDLAAAKAAGEVAAVGGQGNRVTPAPARGVERGRVAQATVVGGSGGRYRVERGDTLYSIARAQGVTPAALKAANPGIDPDRIRPGQILNVPSR
jgi:tetratricopeptide (TPR) repeat protein